MAAAVARHAGARYVVVTDVNPYRLELARKHRRDARGRRPHRHRSPRSSSELGMQEGFDVGLEMSGNPDALPRDAREHVSRRQDRDARAFPTEEIAIDWSPVIFNMLTIKGIYGREMYETWYMMTVMLQGGLDMSPVITHRFHYTAYEEAFEAVRSGNAGKVLLYWREEP